MKLSSFQTDAFQADAFQQLVEFILNLLIQELTVRQMRMETTVLRTSAESWVTDKEDSTNVLVKPNEVLV